MIKTRTTRTTLRIIDKAEYLVQSIRTHMTAVSLRLALAFGELPPKGEGDPPRPDWAQVQQANLDLLEHYLKQGHEADQRYRDAIVAVAEAFKNRNKAAAPVRRRHRGLRKSVQGAHSEASLAVVGLEAPASENALALREECTDVVLRFRKPETRAMLGEPEVGQVLDFDRLADGMEKDLGPFKVAIDAVTEAQKQRDASFVGRKEAEQRLRSVYANVGRVQEGYFRLAGLEDLADRIRLTIPKPSQKVEEPGPDAGDPAEEPDSPPSPPADTPTA